MRALAAAATAALAAAFVTFPAFARDRPIDLAVGAGFDADDTATIAAAAAAWGAALGAPAFRWLGTAPGPVGPCGGPSLVHRNASESSRSYTYVWAAYVGGLWRAFRSDCVLGGGLHGTALYNVALHELGHALGLDHSPASAVMGGALAVDPAGNILPVAARCALNADDAAGLWALAAAAAAPQPAPAPATLWPLAGGWPG